MPEHRPDGAVSDSSANEVPVRRNLPPVQSVGSSSERGGARFDLRLDVSALSARWSSSAALAPALPANCTAPGVTVASDATGDQFGVELGQNQQQDLVSVSIAE